MVSYLLPRHNGYYARLSIPKALQSHYGGRTELKCSLKTSDRKVAKAAALKQVSLWKLGFEALKGSAEAQQKLAADLALMDDKYKTQDHAPMSDKDAAIEYYAQDLNEKDQKEFYDIALGRATPFLLHLDGFMNQWQVTKKTKDMATTVLKRVAMIFPSLEQVKRPLVMKMVQEDTSAPQTKKKNYGFVRQYWIYLQDINAVDFESTNPFTKLRIKDKDDEDSRKDFSVPEIRQLIEESKNDPILCSLIKLAFYTGARLEELCQLKIEDVTTEDDIPSLHIHEAKTRAGNRFVPIHPDLQPLIDQLVKDSKDGYLITDQNSNMYSKRGNALGKRFRRLKVKLGFGSDKVFHSIRKTVITILNNCDVKEGRAADIAGHKKKTITYGLYSGGTRAKFKLDEIKKIRL